MASGRKSRRFDQRIAGAPITGDKGVLIREPRDRVCQGIQHTVSEGHVKSKDGRYHSGGPFFTVSVKPHLVPRTVHIKTGSGSTLREYSGPVVCDLIPDNFGGYTSVSTPKGLAGLEDSSHLDPIGAEAISIVDPLNPNAQLGVALGEIIKDRRLPIPGVQAWKRRTEVAKAAGSEYLNAVFGWLPLVSDMKDTAQSVRDGATILENYHNASGTWVHREFEFPPIESSSESVISTNARANYLTNGTVSDFHAGFVPLTRSRVTSTRRWFSGAFTYSSPGGNSMESMIRARSDADKLFGVNLTPDLVWELTPWSWAIDWFSNASNVIHNVGAFVQAGLVMRYGYMMEETTTVDTYTLPGTGLTGITGTVPPCTITYNVKRRREANPFGFGLSWDGLSPTQLAITAALGITRLR